MQTKQLQAKQPSQQASARTANNELTPFNQPERAIDSIAYKALHTPNALSHGDISLLQRTIGNQAVQRMLQAHRKESLAAKVPQRKFAINEPGDQFEREADLISNQLMSMKVPNEVRPASPTVPSVSNGLSAPHLQRLCSECEEEMLHRKTMSTSPNINTDKGQVQRQTEAKVDAVSGGHPLSGEQRAFFEPRFGADFSRVKIHTNDSADAAACAVGALAYTRGSDIVFRKEQYRPHTQTGRHLLAHELTHVVQQGVAPRIQYESINEGSERQVQTNGLYMGMTNNVVQRWPGDGMVPPGDCNWANYLLLRGSVETAKAVVSTLGAAPQVTVVCS